MPDTINIVEPTLCDEAGHCYSFIDALCQASNASWTLCLWVDRHAQLGFPEENIKVKRYFFRKLRRLQSYFLYKKLLSKREKLFVSTAGRADLQMVAWASKGEVPPQKAYFYFHWININEKKIASLKALAHKQPNLVILGPTPSVAKVFQEAGFSNVHIVPYPISAHEIDRQRKPGFQHLLYAGAARQDKGFSHVVNLIAYLHERKLHIPVILQTSPVHYGKYDEATRADIQRLHNIGYPHLRICPETLSANEYAKLFYGAICLQLYDRTDFTDRVSGVTLDAFSAGTPVVATDGTWIARMAQRFDAGVPVNDMSPSQVFSAVQQVIAEYSNYSRHAYAAGSSLQVENNAGRLFSALVESH